MKKLLPALPGNLSSFFHSVRFRLALWFALILAVILLVFSLFVYYRTAQDVREYTAARLVVRLGEINRILLRAYRDQSGLDWWRIPDSSGSSLFVLKDYEVIIISDPDGNVAGSWGAIDEQEAQQVAAQLPGKPTSRISSYFFTYPVNQAGGSEVEYLFNPAPILSDNRALGWIILGLPVDQENQLPRLLWTLALAGILTLVVALAGGYWLASRALWPVKAVTRTAQEISETDLSQRLNLHTQDELGELANTFDRMLDRLQVAFNRQRQFTADASHELRTPLSIIGLETSRALAEKRPAEEYRRALGVIQSENRFMARLVEELLTLARMDAGRANLKPEPLDLSDLALEAMERYAPLAAQKGIQIQAGEMPELPIQGDRQYLLQMIGNLVDNAIKYNTSASSPERWVRIETGLGRDMDRPLAWLRVSDNGPGISDEHIPHLFDRFYRIDRARSHNLEEVSGDEEIPGSGLGLSIVQNIAQIHGGQVAVQSEPGQGAAFEVRLPVLLDGQVNGAKGDRRLIPSSQK